MDKIIIINASPRAAISNSKIYATIFSGYCNCETKYFNLSNKNHGIICENVGDFSDLLLVFPLYVDGIPVTLLNFLKTFEAQPPQIKPVISVLINCGFLEYRQNDTAVKMIQLFCKKNNYRFGSVLKIGSGEAILNTPFRFLAIRKIKKLAHSIIKSKYCNLQITMPISARMFVKAANIYWKNRGIQNGITETEMRTMKIEE